MAKMAMKRTKNMDKKVAAKNSQSLNDNKIHCYRGDGRGINPRDRKCVYIYIYTTRSTG